jgi:predicted O-methyltransferase YrrM
MTTKASCHTGISATYSKAMQAYEACNIDPVAIAQWCIPELDAQMLVEHVDRYRPKRVLEVGTYVGVSTLLLAITADRETSIVSVDPNLPLEVEMGSMGSALGRLDGARRTQEVAQEVARYMGVDGRIRFVEGGFATGTTFASARNDLSAQVPIVGPKVCQALGPFDLIFIDGLHYAGIVEADLRIAANALAPGGTILMHDCIGMWGTNVRAGIYRFLDEHSEFRLVFPSFHRLYYSIGTVFRADEHPELAAVTRSQEPQGPDMRELANSLAALMVNRLRPSCVVELTLQPIAEQAFARLGLPVTVLRAQLATEPSPAFEDWFVENPIARIKVPQDALVVSFGLMDHLPDHRVEEMLRWIRACDLIGLLGFTPPGEAGVAGRESRSLRSFLRLASKAGLETAGLSRFELDPVQFGFKNEAPELIQTSFCTNVVVVGRGSTMGRIQQDQGPVIIPLQEDHAENVEQENLLRVHYAVAFRRLFANAADLRSQLADLLRSDAELRQQLAAQIARSEDLVRQLAEQMARSEDLVRQVNEVTAALAERAEVERDLRRQLAEQVARQKTSWGW